jgi:hypothetical protein
MRGEIEGFRLGQSLYDSFGGNITIHEICSIRTSLTDVFLPYLFASFVRTHLLPAGPLVALAFVYVVGAACTTALRSRLAGKNSVQAQTQAQ